MANVWFCSDLHFGHKNIGKMRYPMSPDKQKEEDNRFFIVRDWEKVVTKRDIVYVLGDACFTKDTLFEFGELPGKKILIRGNHDILPIRDYLEYFEEVYGLFRYKEFWLSHAPLHPQELRGKINLHGHVHFHNVPDKRYFNCCVENLNKEMGRSLINLAEVRERVHDGTNEKQADTIPCCEVVSR